MSKSDYSNKEDESLKDIEKPRLKIVLQLVLSIIFCYVITPLGIASLVCCILALTSQKHEYDKAKRFLHVAKIINKIACIFIIVFIVLCVLFLVFMWVFVSFYREELIIFFDTIKLQNA